MKKQKQKTEWTYLCTIAAPFLGYGTGAMLGADARIMTAVPVIKKKLKELGRDIMEIEYDQGGHYFDDNGNLETNGFNYKRSVFYNTYEAKMRGIKSRDIPRNTLEKIVIKEA